MMKLRISDVAPLAGFAGMVVVLLTATHRIATATGMQAVEGAVLDVAFATLTIPVAVKVVVHAFNFLSGEEK